MPFPDPPMQLAEGRFARLEAIEWWDQKRLGEARVLVIGAGALGNEVIKNLALLGIGHLVVADMDVIEASNLSRSVLFRDCDQGQPKAACAVRAARQVYGGLQAQAVVGNVLADLGLGYFRWADVVIGALDNREARVFVNSACARVGRPWFDGGIDVFQGVARGFAPPGTACYECTMSAVDWELLNKRRSCSLLARRAAQQRGTPTTPTIASIIGAVQTQEVIKYLHGSEALLGRGFIFDGLGHSSYAIRYPIAPDCPWHEPPAPVEAVQAFDSETPLARIWAAAEQRLGGLDALDFSRELVEALECPGCQQRTPVFQPAEKIQSSQLLCPKCQREGAPVFRHSLAANHPLLEWNARQLGLPAWDILWARQGERVLGLELAGDQAWAKAVSAPEKPPGPMAD